MKSGLIYRLSGRFKKEDGAVAIIAGVSITLLLLMSAFVLDLGYVYVEKSRFQNALDASALAAVNKLPDTEAAVATAVEYIEKNGYSSDDIEVSFSDSDTVIKVEGKKSINYNIAKIIGLDHATITHYAKAQRGSVMSSMKVFDYALFSGHDIESLSLVLEGNNADIYGNVHSNKNFTVIGNNCTITGVCSATGITVIGNNNKIPNRIEGAPFIEMPDFSDVISTQAKEYDTYYNTSVTFGSGNPVDVSNSIFVDGDVTLDNVTFTGKGCLYATGDININGNNFYGSTDTSVCIYSGNGDINIYGNKIVIYGVLYAPNGKIKCEKNNLLVYGRLIGKKIDINGNNLKIEASSKDLENLPKGAPKLVY